MEVFKTLSAMDIFKALVSTFDNEGRYNLFTVMANQLRFTVGPGMVSKSQILTCEVGFFRGLQTKIRPNSMGMSLKNLLMLIGFWRSILSVTSHS
jgi:hypothetical protein